MQELSEKSGGGLKRLRACVFTWHSSDEQAAGWKRKLGEQSRPSQQGAEETTLGQQQVHPVDTV